MGSFLVYPLACVIPVTLLVWLVAEDVSYWIVGPPIILVVALLVIALERWRPYARAWQGVGPDTPTDLLHYGSNVLANQAAAFAYGSVHGLTGGALTVWPSAWPFAAQFILGLVVLDLGLYGVHRASHRIGWLWRLHAIHHSPRRVYSLNSQRRHLVHELLEGAPGLVLLSLLGAPSPVVACALAAVTIHLLFQHANIAYRVGALRRVFAVAELHRWHHQRRYADVQGNYAAVFALWDELLGTALPQRGDAPLDVGMDDEPDLPSDWLGQLAWPFRARRLGTRKPHEAGLPPS